MSLISFVRSFVHSFEGNLGLQGLDVYHGLVSGWGHFYRMCTLRMISFGLDYYWMRKGVQISDRAVCVTGWRE